MNEVKRPKKPLIFYYAVMLVLVLLVNAFLMPWMEQREIKEVDYGTFMTMTENGEVGQVELQSNQILFTDKDKTTVYRTGVIEDPGLVERLHGAGVEFASRIVEQASPLMSFLLSWVVPILLFTLVGQYMSKKLMDRAGGGAGSMMFNLGKSNAKVYVKSSDGIRFDDVEGVDEAEESLQEIVDYLHDPSKYREIGANMPKGVLLVGPPGTGKTLIARAVAGEADVQFLSVSGSDFVELYVGVGAGRVRDLFDQAKKGAPSIVFIDEIDAVGRRRGAGLGGGNDEREQTLNQLLVEMDGFSSNEGVIVMAATNRQDILDPALMRPGRFDRQIFINPPDVRGREAILKVHAKDKMLADDVDLKVIAHATGGFTGADLANLLNEAALYSAKENRPVITMHALEESIMKVIAGPEKRSHVRLERDRRITAYHEAGHAVAMHFLPTQDPVHSITIIPRGKALGMTISLPEEDTDHLTRNEMRENIVGLLGGRVAEKLVFDDISTGASNDIQRATKIAREMVARFGMSEEFGLMGLETIENEYLTGRSVLNCAESTSAQIDEVVKKMLKESYVKAKALIGANRLAMEKIAGYLFEKETITGKEFMSILDLVQTQERMRLEEEEEAARKAKAAEEAAKAAAEEAVRKAKAAAEAAKAAAAEASPEDAADAATSVAPGEGGEASEGKGSAETPNGTL